jgi:glutamine phosphoribosylpyrophosphate amidotransferase
VCGVAGFICRDPESEVGSDLIYMLKELIHRGQDATGMAFYEDRDDIQIRVALSQFQLQKDLEKIIQKYGSVSGVRAYKGVGIFNFYEASVDMNPGRVGDLNWEIDSNPEFCVHSLGKQIKVYKDQGSAETLQACHNISPLNATHGIGHVRLATESVANINFAHPFVSYLLPEMAIVHNGQFTNYFNMRRRLESFGVRFKTNNDSEVAAHFLAYYMKEKRIDLEEALHLALEELDGVFTLLVSTSDQIGTVKDRLGIKPMLFFEKDENLVLFGSEQICLTPIVSDVYASEMEPGGIKIWSV